jgi:3-deoxy-manno-octulosonate cytidylyltransferase (CMP-KDO synthetase)
VCVIPARYASSRLPGKPLALIAGKPMIQWVYEQAIKAVQIDRVIVATDDERIKSTVVNFGGEAILTDPDLPSGTDRVAAAVQNIDADIVVNLQGDEPFVEPELLDSLILAFSNNDIQMATPIKKIESENDLTDPTLARVAKDVNNYALFFTRSVIPYIRDFNNEKWLEKYTFYKHVGIYAYKKSFLSILTGLPQSRLEQAEQLEQLRVLENGYKIYTVETEYESLSVDTPEDLKRVNDLINNRKIG